MQTIYTWLMLDPWKAAAAQSDSVPALRQIDGRSFQVGLLLVLVAILNGVDLVYTLFAHRLGMLNEMNPLAATFLREGLEPSLVSFKLLMILAGGYLLWRSRRSLWSVAGCWILVLAYGGLSVTWYRWSQEVIRMYEYKLAIAG